MWPAGPRTDVERGKWNKAAKELRDGGVTPEQILTAARHWPNVMGAATMTPMALAANLGLLLDGPQVDGRSTGTTLAPKPAAPSRNENPEAALPAWTPEQAAASDAARERTRELMKKAARIGGGA